MANYTLAEATEFYDATKKAYLNALNSSSYTHGENSKSNQRVIDLKKDMDYWRDIKDSLSSKPKKAFANVVFR